jgi:UDP-N-acetylmuramoyl-tripeptide--D-alanyl-D-alanine ligase
LAAVAVGNHFGVGEREAAAALAAYVPANQRSQIVELGELTLILDAYNANPTSMEAALSSFGRVASQDRKRIAILGDMLELGPMEAQQHERLLRRAAELKLDAVLVAGPRFHAAFNQIDGQTPFDSEEFIVRAFESVEALREAFPPEKLGKATVLLKGSRGTSMERWLGDLPLPTPQT